MILKVILTILLLQFFIFASSFADDELCFFYFGKWESINKYVFIDTSAQIFEFRSSYLNIYPGIIELDGSKCLSETESTKKNIEEYFKNKKYISVTLGFFAEQIHIIRSSCTDELLREFLMHDEKYLWVHNGNEYIQFQRVTE